VVREDGSADFLRCSPGNPPLKLARSPSCTSIIRSPGGYLSSLTDRAGEGAFAARAIVLSTAMRRASGLPPLRQSRSRPTS
jgi:hypothetical protein